MWAVPASGGTVTVAGGEYRGGIEVAASEDGLRLVNELGIETYLDGIAEVPGSWPPAALEAQAVAARTYALRAMATAGELCDTTRCQVYNGVSAEHPARSTAADATRGVVRTFEGKLANTVYSASAGGISATPEEGFGTTEYAFPYLQVVRHPTPDPLPWRVEMPVADVGGRGGYRGTATEVAVTETGPSGRPLAVTIGGGAGPMVVVGLGFASALDLRSNLFTIGDGSAPVAPPAPLSGDGSADGGSGEAPPALEARPETQTETETAAAASPGAANPPPLAWAGVALLSVVTAWAMARHGLSPGAAPVGPADRRLLPAVALPALGRRRPR